MNRHHQGKQRKNSIDMTPLMDLTFMLLIVFVITVPVMEYATDVTPPELNGERSLSDEDSKPLVIALSDDGSARVDEQNVPLYQLTDYLVQVCRGRGVKEVMIRADGGRPYSEVVFLMRAAKQAGIPSVSLMTQAETAR